MFILSNFIMAVAKVLGIVLNLYMWLIVIRAVVSWFSPDPYNQIYIFLVRVTEPVLGYIRRFLPPAGRDDGSVSHHRYPCHHFSSVVSGAVPLRDRHVHALRGVAKGGPDEIIPP